MDSLFAWKWYYAFQQVGDQKASALSKAYRNAILKKDAMAGNFSYLSPAMMIQRLMSSIAKTNTIASMTYEQKIRDYHQKLREFYYPLLFDETEFNYQIMSELPQFSEQIKISKNDKENS